MGDFKVIIWWTGNKWMGPFLQGELPLKKPCKYFNMVIGGGLVWIKWLKNGVGKGFIFHAIIPVLYPQNA